ncbi:ATP-binding protein [Rheinheimera soli]|uniref:Signal transduction histidine kinase n=1 Tax=Rheinheimera soli TaxID=443616 RepID=A0ABU1VVD9_9GAMM|nr:ATP-binding protein [Rheinheimera soli]MDR7119691.1 signal transduction histidine kinase [Rheinheimera soli]
MHNPFRLAEPQILQQQLTLVMRHFRSTLVIIPICLLVWWTLSNEVNTPYLHWWAAGAVSSNLLLQLYSWYCLNRTRLEVKIRRKAMIYTVLHLVDGCTWGLLSWLVLSNVSDVEGILVMGVFAGMLGGSLATLSPVPLFYLAFALPQVTGIISKLWFMEDIIYHSLAMAGFLYFFALLGQLLNSTKTTLSAITMTFELANSNAKLRAIEKSQTLEQERQRLMQEMHDGLGSSLVSALRVVENGKMQSGELAGVLKDCIDDLKLAIDSIEPVDDDLLLLLATLRFRLGARLENTGIRLQWKVAQIPPLDWLDPRSSLHVLRILQEAFTNIIKHTKATEVTLSTRLDADSVVVTVTDNGGGFELTDAIQSGGRGLASQLHRAKAIGAEVSWLSDSKETSVMLKLPVKQKYEPG